MEEIKSNNFPNLFIPGAAKSGTSTLHELLNQHPEISMSSNKEPFYLAEDHFEMNKHQFNSKYEALFSDTNTKYRGDSSTAYMLFPNFIERVKTHLKFEKKFIFVLRNPVDRIYSHYWYIKGLGSETLNLRQAIKQDMDIEPNMSTRLSEGKFKHYFQYGLYGKWLTRFYDNFDSDSIKIILFEDLKENPLQTVNECFRFLDLAELDAITPVESNKTIILKHSYLHKYVVRVTNGRVKLLKPLHKLIPKRIKAYLKKNSSEFIINTTKSNKEYPKLSNQDRQWLTNLYKEDFMLLKTIVQKDFSKWTDFNHYL